MSVKKIPTLGEAFCDVEGLFVNAEYKDIPGYRFKHDEKKHHHDALAANIDKANPAYDIRHLTIQDVTNSVHVEETLRRAAQYGMNGIQFSGDNIFWVNDSLMRYNMHVHTGMLCEQCHDHGLKAYFWTHEFNDFFHEFVTDGKYGFSGQLSGGTIDLSSTSGIWDKLYEKYDVFFRRLPCVDGIVLTLNECQVPVFRDECVTGDLTAAERVAKIGKTIKAACDKHGKHLILRTFCYYPEELENIRAGVEAIGKDITLMIKCVPHDWQTFYPHNSLIEQMKGFAQVIEFDLAHEPMGAGRFPYPDTEHIKHRFDHIHEQGAIGVAGRIDRFRCHADGTVNWSNVYSFARLAHDPAVDVDQLLEEYAAADFGEENKPFVVDALKRLYAAGQVTFFNAKEWGSQHSNLLKFEAVEQPNRWSRALWDPSDEEGTADQKGLTDPTPEFIEARRAEKAAALLDLKKLAEEIEVQRSSLNAADADYLAEAVDRSIVLCDALTHQHLAILMVRHDAKRAEDERKYSADLDEILAHLRELAASGVKELRDCGNEGCQYGDQIIERFCRNCLRHLGRLD